MSDFIKLKFANEAKIRKQLVKRGWTEKDILEALQTPGIATFGKLGPASR